MNKLAWLHVWDIFPAIACCLWDHAEGSYSIIHAALKITTRASEQKVQPSQAGNACSSQCQCAFWSLLSTIIPVVLGWRTTTNAGRNRRRHKDKTKKFLQHFSLFQTQQHPLSAGWFCWQWRNLQVFSEEHLVWLVTCPWWTPAFCLRRAGIGSSRPPWP